MKRILALILVIAMAFAMTTVALAAPSGTSSGSGSGTSTGGGGFYIPPSGDKTVRQTLSDGTVVETTTHKDGTVTIVTTKVEEWVNEDGTKVIKTTVTTVEKNKEGEIVSSKTEKFTEVLVSKKDAEDGKVLLPTDLEKDKTIPVDVKTDKPVEITAPVKGADEGTVVILVDKDGNETILKDCYVTEDGIVFVVNGNAQVRITDNTKAFNDVSGWAAGAIQFVAAREIFVGIGDGSFAPNGLVTRAMVYTVLARLNGADVVTTGSNWYAEPLAWAVENGISDGTNPMNVITREQLATMLYRMAGAPEVEYDLSAFGDANTVSEWALSGMKWAVANGLIKGIGGNLVPQGETTRAEFAAVMQRYMTNIR